LWPTQDGFIYSVYSTPHPYARSTTYTHSVSNEGAAKIKVHFSKFETESNDVVELIGDGNVQYAYSGNLSRFDSDWVTGNFVVIRMVVSGSLSSAYGWDIEGFTAVSKNNDQLKGSTDDNLEPVIGNYIMWVIVAACVVIVVVVGALCYYRRKVVAAWDGSFSPDVGINMTTVGASGGSSGDSSGEEAEDGSIRYDALLQNFNDLEGASLSLSEAVTMGIAAVTTNGSNPQLISKITSAINTAFLKASQMDDVKYGSISMELRATIVLYTIEASPSHHSVRFVLFLIFLFVIIG
jgi:hypothetical protein